MIVILAFLMTKITYVWIELYNTVEFACASLQNKMLCEIKYVRYW